MTRRGAYHMAACVLVMLLAAGGVAGCAPTAGGLEVLPTWPVPPELLPDAVSASGEIQVTCGGRTFPAAGLDAPTGAEKASGPEFDALRQALTEFAAAFPGSSNWEWQLAGRDDSGATFVAKTDALGPPGWVSVDVEANADGWRPLGMGQCGPRVVLSAEFGPASWALDPSEPQPSAEALELHILVWERACSNGSPATGRVSAPVVQYDTTTVTITLGVRPVRVGDGVALTCPGPPGTPAILRLAEPIGDRTLLDGGVVPAAPPTSP